MHVVKARARAVAWRAAGPRAARRLPMIKECPLCTERMRLETRETITRVPGTAQVVRRVVREWVCRECDYFEEAEDGATGRD